MAMFDTLMTKLERPLSDVSFESRRVLARAIYELRALARRAGKGQRRGQRVALVLPRSANAAMLGEALNRIAWYLGAAREEPATGLMLDIHVPRHLLHSEATPPAIQPWYGERLAGARVQRVARGTTLASYDHIVLWRASSLLEPSIARAIERVVILDPTFFRGTEFSSAQALMQNSVDTGRLDEIRALSRHNLERLVEQHGGAGVCYALGTGPSLHALCEARPTLDGPALSCNGIGLADEEMLDWLRPAAICLADEALFAPSELSEQYRRAAARCARRYDTFVVVPESWLGVMLRQHPELERNLVGLRVVAAEDWVIPSLERPEVRQTFNIMTMLVVPLAAALGRTIRIAGCDGTPDGTVAKWRHAVEIPPGWTSDIRATHPGMYRDLRYGKRFAIHYDVFDQLLSWLERHEHPVEVVAPSYIPALRERMASSDS